MVCLELSELTSSIPIGVTVWKCASRDQRHSSGKGFPPSFLSSRLSPSLSSSLPCSTSSSLSPSLPPSLPAIVIAQARSGCPVCGVIRVDCQHPKGGDRSPEASGKKCLSTQFQVESVGSPEWDFHPFYQRMK